MVIEIPRVKEKPVESRLTPSLVEPLIEEESVPVAEQDGFDYFDTLVIELETSSAKLAHAAKKIISLAMADPVLSAFIEGVNTTHQRPMLDQEQLAKGPLSRPLLVDLAASATEKDPALTKRLGFSFGRSIGPEDKGLMVDACIDALALNQFEFNQRPLVAGQSVWTTINALAVVTSDAQLSDQKDEETDKKYIPGTKDIFGPSELYNGRADEAITGLVSPSLIEDLLESGCLPEKVKAGIREVLPDSVEGVKLGAEKLSNDLLRKLGSHCDLFRLFTDYRTGMPVPTRELYLAGRALVKRLAGIQAELMTEEEQDRIARYSNAVSGVAALLEPSLTPEGDENVVNHPLRRIIEEAPEVREKVKDLPESVPTKVALASAAVLGSVKFSYKWNMLTGDKVPVYSLSDEAAALDASELIIRALNRFKRFARIDSISQGQETLSAEEISHLLGYLSQTFGIEDSRFWQLPERLSQGAALPQLVHLITQRLGASGFFDPFYNEKTYTPDKAWQTFLLAEKLTRLQGSSGKAAIKELLKASGRLCDLSLALESQTQDSVPASLREAAQTVEARPVFGPGLLGDRLAHNFTGQEVAAGQMAEWLYQFDAFVNVSTEKLSRKVAAIFLGDPGTGKTSMAIELFREFNAAKVASTSISDAPPFTVVTVDASGFTPEGIKGISPGDMVGPKLIGDVMAGLGLKGFTLENIEQTVAIINQGKVRLGLILDEGLKSILEATSARSDSGSFGPRVAAQLLCILDAQRQGLVIRMAVEGQERYFTLYPDVATVITGTKWAFVQKKEAKERLRKAGSVEGRLSNGQDREVEKVLITPEYLKGTLPPELVDRIEVVSFQSPSLEELQEAWSSPVGQAKDLGKVVAKLLGDNHSIVINGFVIEPEAQDLINRFIARHKDSNFRAVDEAGRQLLKTIGQVLEENVGDLVGYDRQGLIVARITKELAQRAFKGKV